MLKRLGQGRLQSYSAGSHPTGVANPRALEALERMKLPATGFRSKSRDEYTGPAAPPHHFVFTVCDKAVGEVCPIWPGQPITALWGVEDPAAFVGSDEARRAAFMTVLRILTRRVELFLNLPLERIDNLALKERLAKGARCSLEEQATMSKSAFELRRSELLATWKARAEGWLKARGAVNTCSLEEPPG